MPESITVTVTLDMADVIDVLAWHESTDYGWEHHGYKPNNERWLAAYQDADAADREELWRSMPASLQWCLHELEQRGVTPLWWALSAARVPDPRILPKMDHDLVNAVLDSVAREMSTRGFGPVSLQRVAIEHGATRSL